MQKRKFIIFITLLFTLTILAGCSQTISEKDLKIVGDNQTGYIKIPKDFTKMQEKTSNGTPMNLYADKKQTFTVNLMPLNAKGGFEQIVENTSKGYSLNGSPLEESRTTINGRKVVELTNSKGKEQVTISIIDGRYSTKVLIFTYVGNGKKYKQQILESFQEKM